MNSNLTQRASNLVYNLAQQEAKNSGSEQVLPEHVLIALIKSKDGNGYTLLEKVNIDIDEFLELKKDKGPLSLQEILIALPICSVTNPMVGDALKQLDKLKNCDAHSSHIITNGELKSLKGLGIKLTCEPKFKSDNLYRD